MSHDTLVLGAGMVGVSVAYHLARRGHDVTLVDRRPPGRETSYGNAGIIQREAVVPYSFPRDLGTLARILPNRRIDVRYRWRGLGDAAEPLWRYWKNSTPAAYARLVPEYASLIALATQEHAPMIAAARAESLVSRRGWLEMYRSEALLVARLAAAESLADRFGLAFEGLDRTALKAEEPSLGEAALGAIRWRDAWTVTDPGALVASYAKAFEAEGGSFHQAEIGGLRTQGTGWRVETTEGALEARQLVLALGPWSGGWLAGLGYRFPLFVKRGYHRHYDSGKGGLNNWLLDAEMGYLLAPMRIGIRMTTGVELAPLEAVPDERQLEAAERMARGVLPLGKRLEATAWLGARPCCADMKPIIGPAPRHSGLWLACGHGYQGFTLGPATGRLLAELMDDEPPAIGMAPFAATRF